MISIWFFIGVVLVLDGLIITGAAVYGLVVPPAPPPVLWGLHAGLWWGLLILVMGTIYTVKYAPRRSGRNHRD